MVQEGVTYDDGDDLGLVGPWASDGREHRLLIRLLLEAAYHQRHMVPPRPPWLEAGILVDVEVLPWAWAVAGLKIVLLIRPELGDHLLELCQVVVVLIVVETLAAWVGEHILIFFDDVELAAVVA